MNVYILTTEESANPGDPFCRTRITSIAGVFADRDLARQHMLQMTGQYLRTTLTTHEVLGRIPVSQGSNA